MGGPYDDTKMSGKKFVNAYEKAREQWKGKNLDPFNINTALWAVAQGLALKGDFVECGVYQGMFARAILEYFDGLKGRQMWLIDTYKGLIENYCLDHEWKSFEGAYPDCYDFVVNSFKNDKSIKIIRGVVPDILSKLDIKKVAYLSLDMNCVFPEIEALKFFWPKMEKGATVLLDDYACAGHESQREAMDEFAKQKGIQVLFLTTGQGIMIKI